MSLQHLPFVKWFCRTTTFTVSIFVKIFTDHQTGSRELPY